MRRSTTRWAGRRRSAPWYTGSTRAETFRALVHRFYQGVATDPILRPMYPEEDLGPAEDRLRMFLEQYWGGPHTYSERRGHPRLRMRHVPFAIGTRERLAWLRHMRAALDTLELDEEHDQALWNYLRAAALSLQNRIDDDEIGADEGRTGLPMSD